MSRPLAIDLFCGSFGWSAGLVAAGFRCVGFDISHEPYHGPVPPHCELVLQDCLTLHGSQFKEAQLIVASPPCQKYSFMAMPWKRAKLMAAEIRGNPFKRYQLNALYRACFRIQREASEASGRHIPLVVENVKGAQPWVGRAAWHYGSFYLWGDLPALMPSAHRLAKVPGLNWSGSDQPGYVAKAFNDTAIEQGRKVPGFNSHQFEKTGKPAGRFQSAAVREFGLPGGPDPHGPLARKVDPCAFYGTDGGPLPDGDLDCVLGNVHNDTRERTACGVLRGIPKDAGRKGTGGGWFSDLKEDGTRPDWRESGCETRKYNSKSPARKAASAAIAKIPFDLAYHIGRVYHPGIEVTA